LVTGPLRDAIIKIKARNISELNLILDELRNIKGVKRTDTMNILYEARKETAVPIRRRSPKAYICPEIGYEELN
jgi:DNA-binding Lrp family transcriptional regulator